MNRLVFGRKAILQAPADDDGGSVEDIDDDDGGSVEDTDDGDTDDDDGGSVEDTDDDDTDDDDTDDDDDTGANKRIRELVAAKKTAEAKVKTLEKELAEAKKLGGDDGKAILAAAERSGILPTLMTKDEANAFERMGEIPVVVERYEDWLDDHDKDEELELGNGTTLKYGDVKKRVRKLRGELSDLEDRYGDKRRELNAKARKIFETGVAALEAGWTPGGGKKPGKKEGGGKKPVAGRAKTSTPGPDDRNSLGHRRKGGTRPEDIEVTDSDSLEDFIAAGIRKAKK